MNFLSILSGHSLGMKHNQRVTSIMYPLQLDRDTDYLDDMDKSCMAYLYGKLQYTS